MEERRYGQRGYKEHEKERERQGKPKEPSRSGTPAMLPTRTVSRCVDCGTLLPPLIDPFGQCPKCKSELHSCRQCAHFDPGHRFDCTQPIPERIANKNARNACTFFSMHVTVERETASGAASPEDPRRALDNLFKKKWHGQSACKWPPNQGTDTKPHDAASCFKSASPIHEGRKTQHRRIHGKARR